MNDETIDTENTAPDQPAAAPTHEPQVHRILGLVDGEWQELVAFDYARNHEGQAVYPQSGPQVVQQMMQMRQRRERSAVVYGVLIDLTLPAFRCAVG